MICSDLLAVEERMSLRAWGKGLHEVAGMTLRLHGGRAALLYRYIAEGRSFLT